MAPPGAGAPPEQFVPLPQVARAFGFLYDVNGRLDMKVLKTIKDAAKAVVPERYRGAITAVTR